MTTKEDNHSDSTRDPRDIYLIHPKQEIHAPGLAGENRKYAELSLDQVRATFSTIKRDDANTKIVYLAMVSTYAPDKDQLNVAFNSPSCTGKSYITLEVAKAFPEDDIVSYAHATPTALWYDRGALVERESGVEVPSWNLYASKMLEGWQSHNPRPEERGEKGAWVEARRAEKARLREVWEKIDKVHRVDLSHKIVLFLDAPSDAVLKRLRPLMSHDKKVLEAAVTDRNEAKSLETKHIQLIGFPTVFFLSTGFSLDEQERTRTIALSGDMTQDKIKDAIEVDSKRLADRMGFDNGLQTDADRLSLSSRIRDMRDMHVSEIVVPQDLMDGFQKQFIDRRQCLEPRHTRDFQHIIALVKAHALNNLWTRRTEQAGQGIRVFVEQTDIDAVSALYNEIYESNKAGLPPYVYEFLQFIRPIPAAGYSRAELKAKYFSKFKVRCGDKRLKSILELLVETGLVDERQDPDDKRFSIICEPQQPEVELDFFDPLVLDIIGRRPGITESDLKVEAMKTGCPGQRFDTLFSKMKNDPRLQRNGTTPVCYTLAEGVAH